MLPVRPPHPRRTHTDCTVVMSGTAARTLRPVSVFAVLPGVVQGTATTELPALSGGVEALRTQRV